MKLIPLILLISFLFCSSIVNGQDKRLAFENEVFVNRSGVFHSINSTFQFSQFSISIGTGFQWGNLLKNNFYSPQVNTGLFYSLVLDKKLDISLGLRYVYAWRRYPFNTSANSHSLCYGYRLVYGERWLFLHNLGVGGLMRSDFPDKHRVLLDVHFSIGVGYAF